MRKFNTSGPNIPAKHYSLPRWDWMEKGKELIHDERYFTIWAPRQTGKSTYFRFLGQIERINTEKMVLIIEGIDEINTAYLWTFLSSIRSAFHSRQDHALKSVILSGVSNTIRNAPNDRIPFNIGDDFILPYFSNDETRTLLEQHENETGQLFEDIIFKVPLYQKYLHNL